MVEHEVARASVLVVGEAETRLALSAALAPLGVDCVLTGSVDEALRQHLHEDFALLLLVPAAWDEGRHEARRLVAGWHGRATPLIVLLAEPRTDWVREAHALGAVDCLGRELEPDLLRAKVSAFVSLHSRHLAARRVQEALDEREAPLHFALEAAGLGHWRLDLASLRLECSSGCKLNFGLSPEDDLSSYAVMRSYIHPEDRDAMGQSVERALATRGGYASDYRVIAPGGRMRWVAARGRVVCDASGTPVSMVGITLDITERMRGAQKLAFLAEASRLLSASLEPEDVLRRVARFASGSIAAYCLVDLLEEEGGLRRVAMAHRDPAQEQRIARMWDAIPGRHEARLPLEALRQDCTTLYADFSDAQRQRAAMNPAHLALIEAIAPRSLIIVPLRGHARPWGVITLARTEGECPFDEEDVELAEELARRAVVALENARLLRTTRAAVQLRDEFLSVASHELKTPLTSLSLRLQGLARAARRDGSESVPRRLPQEVEAMRLQVKRLSGLMDALLDVSRLDAEALRLEREPVDLAALVRRSVDHFAAEAARAHCLLECVGNGPIEGWWDRARLEQVLEQLLTNAFKYGAGHPVHVAVGTEGPRAWLRVRDEGIGIDADALPRLFDKFERAVSVRNYGGLGLGLYLVRRILQSHQGSIHVESSPGQGATFTAWLPWNTAARTAPTQDTPPAI
ncbi:ATP-binding protein [Archangium primigenium]|uniref:ATP-binding protein n=1 Tax=[Archangium] primigenium TaxID=2792470 RepID=UPI00195D49F6|nr:PAS domain-containing sensor histidine kinase [Archangium primigenium]